MSHTAKVGVLIPRHTIKLKQCFKREIMCLLSHVAHVMIKSDFGTIVYCGILRLR